MDDARNDNRHGARFEYAWFYFYVCEAEKQEVLILILLFKCTHVTAFSKDAIRECKVIIEIQEGKSQKADG